MPFNGNGVFQRVYNWVQDAANGILVRADRMDTEMEGMATGLSNCITRDGQSIALANLPMNGYRHTNVSNAQNGNEYATLAQAQSGAATWGGTSTGGGYSYTVSPSPSVTSVPVGFTVRWKANANNLSLSPTFQVGSVSGATLVKKTGAALALNEIVAGTLYETTFDGTNWVILTALTTLDSLNLLSTLTAVGGVNNTPIGNVTRNSGAFTTVSATGTVLTTGAGVGYATGAGGSVVQPTSKSTAVTLNTICGQVTTNNSAVTAGSVVSFLVNNTLVTASDTVVVNLLAAAGNYDLKITPQNGSFIVIIKNTTAGTLTDALPFNFAIIKSVLS